jgi:hypothetical protein
VDGLDLDLAPRLRDALLAADFTFDHVVERLGPRAHGALARKDCCPPVRGMRSTR